MFKKKEYVYAVYEEHSFTKAAKKLYISQPCLSAAIKKIEDEIGMPLFKRRYSQVIPTEIGADYIKTAERIMALENEFASKVKDIDDMEYGKIKIGGSNYVCSYILPPILDEFSRRYPKIELSIGEANSKFWKNSLNNETVDLVIDSYDGIPEDLTCHPLVKENILLAVPAALKCNKGLEKYGIRAEELYLTKCDTHKLPELEISAFKDERFIILKSGMSMYDHAMKVFKNCGFEPRIAFEMSQLMTSYTMAMSIGCVCFVSDTMFSFHHFTDDVYLYNIKNSGTRNLCISEKKNYFTSAAMERFIEVAKEFI